jgi:hypothetical protein
MLLNNLLQPTLDSFLLSLPLQSGAVKRGCALSLCSCP